jgi:hypothetical protein
MGRNGSPISRVPYSRTIRQIDFKIVGKDPFAARLERRFRNPKSSQATVQAR